VILDTSAIIAVLFEESDAPAYAHAMNDAPSLAIAAPTLVEATIVSEGRTRPGMRDKLDALLGTLRPDIVPFTAEHAALAADGWRRFGKGRHPAGLNLGDCFAYALARSRGEPLLFKGDDFSKTDVKAALQPHA
jgi:ribonuclease VapC